MLVRSLVTNRLSPYTSSGPRPHMFGALRAHGLPPITLPSFSAISSLIFPRDPTNPHVILSFPGTERFQLSDTALGDLNMKFRLRVLCRLNKLGVRFTSEKQQALLRGDTSGTVIHPFFIHCTQALGMYFCEDMVSSPAMIRLHAKHIRMSSESVADIFETHDWELRTQVAVWTMAGSVILQLDYMTHLYV
ncbi:hypothetical protein BDM02DRAFT_389138 [Thelephora ganbajun]|uniref:Uncharacterized protein n=1 Tax=Thelephora ganbajun TaxID=370292 RepID=A0ACB6Z8I3_THEGA|nr:hypothetical protein BDM02DRAFT_389138 [Thelephora ganbajun]